jgi:FixJ family two-component response regulator
MCLDSTVFLIDDDAAVRDALSISLSLSGLKIEVYSSGKAFLAVYKENRPGCLLINLSQPDMGGLAVQQELIKRNFSIPIIYMTEIGSICNSVSTVQSEAFCFLEKPFPRSLLLQSIREAMEQDCGKRSAIKNPVETHNKSADPQSCYKRISPREGAIMSLIMLGKSSKPIAGMLKHTLRTAVICRTHLAELMVI